MDSDNDSPTLLWLPREKVEGLSHPEIVAVMLERAASDGYEPIDLNWAGTPNVYLRGNYKIYDTKLKLIPTKSDWIKDGFVMYVRKVEMDGPGNAPA